MVCFVECSVKTDSGQPELVAAMLKYLSKTDGKKAEWQKLAKLVTL